MAKLKVDTEIEDVLSTEDAAKQLGIGYATLYRWLKAGKINAVRIGGRTLIPTSEIGRLKHG